MNLADLFSYFVFPFLVKYIWNRQVTNKTLCTQLHSNKESKNLKYVEIKKETNLYENRLLFKKIKYPLLRHALYYYTNPFLLNERIKTITKFK